MPKSFLKPAAPVAVTRALRPLEGKPRINGCIERAECLGVEESQGQQCVSLSPMKRFPLRI